MGLSLTVVRINEISQGKGLAQRSAHGKCSTNTYFLLIVIRAYLVPDAMLGALHAQFLVRTTPMQRACHPLCKAEDPKGQRN